MKRNSISINLEGEIKSFNSQELEEYFTTLRRVLSSRSEKMSFPQIHLDGNYEVATNPRKFRYFQVYHSENETVSLNVSRTLIDRIQKKGLDELYFLIEGENEDRVNILSHQIKKEFSYILKPTSG